MARAVAVSDTSPLRYLVLIGRAGLVHQMFSRVLIPRAVELELMHSSAPAEVRRWLQHRPPWLETHTVATRPDLELQRQLDYGEAEALQLAIELRPDFVLMDELPGREDARKMGIRVVGILGIVIELYRRDLVTGPMTILEDLRIAGFRLSTRLTDDFGATIRDIDLTPRSEPRR